MVGPVAKREGVVHLRAVMGLSERRACSIVDADRKMIRYRSCRPPDTELRTQLRDLANARRRFGYRRLFILLRQDGEPSGINRIYRLYREEGLTVRKRRGRRRAAGTRAPILVEAAANARWSLDFIHDQLACGRRFRILNIVDDVTRECLAAIPDTSISGRRVARELTVLIERRGKPSMIVSDNGTEFTSNAMLAWAQDNTIVWHFIAPGKPMHTTNSIRSGISSPGKTTSREALRHWRNGGRLWRRLPPTRGRVGHPQATAVALTIPRRGPTAACAISLTSCPDSAERTGIRFEKERVYGYSGGAKALRGRPLAPAIAPIRGSRR
jgi:transposase InsO family protein